MRRLTSLLSVAAALLLAAPSFATFPGDAFDADARIRVFHASPSPTPAVDVLAGGDLIVPDLAFGMASDYLTVPANVYDVEVVEAGTAGPAVIAAPLSLFYDSQTTVVATGEFPNLTPIILSDDNSRVDPRRTRVRFFHGSMDTGPVSVRASGGPVWVDELAYQDASPYVEVPAGAYELLVSVVGTSITVPVPADLPGGAVVTVWAIGLSGDGSLEFVVTVDRERPFFGDDGDGDEDEDEDENEDEDDEESLRERLRDFFNR